MQDLLRAHARLTWQILCALDPKQCPQQGANTDESSFSEPPPSLRLDALENFVRGLDRIAGRGTPSLAARSGAPGARLGPPGV